MLTLLLIASLWHLSSRQYAFFFPSLNKTLYLFRALFCAAIFAFTDADVMASYYDGNQMYLSARALSALVTRYKAALFLIMIISLVTIFSRPESLSMLMQLRSNVARKELTLIEGTQRLLFACIFHLL